jgi:hypothetical protein
MHVCQFNDLQWMLAFSEKLGIKQVLPVGIPTKKDCPLDP